MIQIQVSLALNLLDGFTGRPLSPAQAHLTLDGERAQAIVKEGGWWVLCDLAPGTHELCVSGPGFQDEKLSVKSEYGMQAIRLRLKPSAEYRFGRRVTTLNVLLKNKKGELLSGRTLYALLSGRENELRIAQDEVKTGEKQLKLYSAVAAASQPVPGLFLMGEGAQAELVRLSAAQEGGIYRLTNPIGRDRKRGCVLRAAASYTTDCRGSAFIALRQEQEAHLVLIGTKGALREEQVPICPLEHNEVTLTI